MSETEHLRVTARWLLPAAGEPLQNAVLEIAQGSIVSLGAGRKADIDFGNAVILPGFVNCHTHLDLTGLRGLNPPGDDRTEWLMNVIRFRRSLTEDEIDNFVAQGLAETLRHGTTLIGDITGDGRSWRTIAESPIRAIVYREMLGLPKERAEQAWQKAQSWLGESTATDRCRPGLSPHAPYSTRTSLIRAAGSAGVPVAIHLAEFLEERELLEEQSGPFKKFLQELGVWDPLGLARSPEHVIRLLNGSEPTLLVHGNYLAPTAPIPDHATVVYCPRTHESFGHQPHPVSDLLHRGVRVALGTDSLASNPDLSMLGEMRFLHAVRPDLPARTIVEMATSVGAAALGWLDRTGTLEPGKFADFTVVPLPLEDSDPLEMLLESAHDVAETWIAGRCVFRRHQEPSLEDPD